MRRIQLQLLFVLIAALSVAALSALLISNAIHSAESVVVSDTRKTLATANAELIQQYVHRANSDTSWATLPVAAQNVSLRAISQATLRSFPGVEGGFSVNGKLLGYAFPTHGSPTLKLDVPEAELPQIGAAVAQARAAGDGLQILSGSRDLVVIEAVLREGCLAWTMKRISGITDPGQRRRSLLLIALVVAALVSVFGTLTAVIGLRRGLTEIEAGLARLESDFAFELPSAGGELGRISKSINRVASSRRSLEAEVRREDRLRAIGQLSANIAHEIRNPLNGIRLAMQVVKQKLSRQEIREGDLDLVVEEVDRLNALLTDLLAFRQARKPALEWQPLLPIVERIVRLVEPRAHDKGVAICLHSSTHGTSASVDAKQLTQVLTNLLLNALAAVPKDGKIEVRVLTGDDAKHAAVIEICDNGPGIAPERREHLFEPFYTTRSEGTGLGLAVSRELMQGMGGAINYRDGQPGAVFVLSFKES